ncbi:threonine synthase [PVC group bacterium]|nr:threonine synthase [PVC group bacterium]
MGMKKGIIHTYREYLPVTDQTPVISLQEGATPLIHAKNLSAQLKSPLSVYLKCEGMNPSGSFKDRGMTLAVSKALEKGAKAVMCASTGNTSASAAAYAAKSGIKCVVIIPEGNIALGKLSQALVHGAQVISIKGNFDDALRIAREVTRGFPIELVNSINPYRIEGQKTGAFEICDQLGKAPDYHVLPVGNAGNITAYWKGYKEYRDKGRIKELPVMLGFQAAGAAPIVLGKVVKNPRTIATAIRIGNPASWKQAEEARDESKGLIDSVTDDEIIEAYKLLAKSEGVFCEPASAAAVAGIIKKDREGYFGSERKTAVAVLTGHGLKDPDRAIGVSELPVSLAANVETIAQAIGF